MADYKKVLGVLNKALQEAPNKRQAARMIELGSPQLTGQMGPEAKEIQDIMAGRWNPDPLAVKVATDIPPPLPRAKPRSKEEMLEIVHRVGPQLKGEFVRSKKKGASESVAGKSKKRYEHEATLAHDIEAKDQQELPVLDIADRLGSVDVSLAGDASRLGTLRSVGGLKLKRPVELQAGPLFEEGWASGASTSLDYWKMLDRIQKQYGGAPVNAVFSNMGAEGLNFAAHYADALLESINSAKIPKKNLNALDQMMRNAFPEFVGVRNQDEAHLQMMLDPNLRKHFTYLMEQVGVGENLKLPRGYDVKHAVEEPMLRTTEPALAGFVVKKPKLGLTHLPVELEHNTYDLTMPMETMGRQRVLYPREVQFPDMLESIRNNPRQAPNEVGSLHYSVGRQIIDPQQVDQVKLYEELMKQEYGLRKGGEVHMAGGGDAAKAKKLMDIASGVKKVGTLSKADAALAKHMDDLLHASEEMNQARARLPLGTDAARAKIEREFAEAQAKKDALYKVDKPPVEKGNKALAEAKRILAGADKQAESLIQRIEAPTVIIPSKLSEVERYVKDREGSYGVDRVQRAADQVKNLEQQYTEQALKQAFSGDNARALMIGNPADFQKFAMPIEEPYRPAVDKYKGLMTGEGGGAEDVPYLLLNKEEGMLPYVSGHEGRHRNLALEELGDENTLWRMLPSYGLRERFPRRYQDEYINAIRDEIGATPLVIPENAVNTRGKKNKYDFSKAINLPEMFAEGGGVHMAEGGKPRKYVPPSQLFPLKTEEPSTLGMLSNAASNIKDAAIEEGKTYGDKGATMDIINRGPVADVLGGFVDLANLPLQGLDYLASKIPAFSKPASVMEPEGERVSIAPVSSDEPFGGSEAWRKQFQKSGITSMTERPLTEMAVSLASPLAPIAGAKALKAGKALAPTAGKLAQEFAEKTQFGMPLELNAVPMDDAAKAAYSATMREKYAAKNAAKGTAEKAPEVKVPANDLGLYSSVEKASMNLQRKSGNGDAFIADLMKQPDVSQAKLDETGLTAALKGRKGVTRDEVQQLAAEGKVPVQESVRRDVDNDELIQSLQSQIRTMEGGIENLKREILDNRDHPWNAARREKIEMLKDGIEKNKSRIEESRPALFKPEDYPEYSTRGGDNYREIRIKLPKLADNDQNFYQTNHHGNEANVLAHMRVADHVDAEGKKGLLIDELQSDWHQKGRDRGYSAQLTEDEKVRIKQLEQMMKDGSIPMYDRAEYSQLINKRDDTVPDAPFKEDWYQLGLKRAIKEAADSGMDRVYLTTGKTQADRYSLSTHINDIHYLDNGDGTYKILPRAKGAENAMSEINGVDLKSVPKDKLQEVVGKEVANKIIKNEGNVSGRDSDFNSLMRLDNVDLQVGGEGMRQYYDKTYLNWLKKYAKQHGAEVGITELPSAARTRADLSAKQMHEMMDNPEFKQILDEEFGKGGNERNAWDTALKRFGGQKVYYLDLNPALKNTAKKGQAFAGGGAVQSPNDFDYESHVNNIMNAHNASNFDYEGHVKKIMGMAEGGAAYNTEPDMSDGGISIQAPAFKIGGRIPLLTR